MTMEKKLFHTENGTNNQVKNQFQLTSAFSRDPRPMSQQTNAHIFATMVNHPQMNTLPGLDFY